MSCKIILLNFVVLWLWDFSVSQRCGSVLSESSGVITSEGHPQGYPSFYDCTWTIQANSYDQVNILFRDFNVEPGENCDFDWLEISAAGNSKKFCGDKLSDVGYNGRLQLGGSVKLQLVSDDSVNLRGFSLQYQVTAGEPPPSTPPPTTVPTTTPEPNLTCDDEPCLNDGECTMIDATEFFCFCEDGYEGTRCEIAVDECASNPCQNGATCKDGVNSWECECVEGFMGDTCSINIDDCLKSSCKNGATCEDRVNIFHCVCVRGWTGWDCGREIDECDPNPCLNHGVCDDHVGYHTCICHPKFTGPNCSIPLETESTEFPDVHGTTAPTFSTLSKPKVDLTTPSELRSLSNPTTLPTNAITSPTPKSQPEKAPKANGESDLRAPPSTNKPIVTTPYSNTTGLGNATIQNVEAEILSGLPIPALIGGIGGFMSFVGIAASIYRFCNSPSNRPVKVQPIGDGPGRGPYFEH